ncbi:SseB family protein [Nocardioides sp. MAHUQ-72]|uniref:SseB family protein n=1 Tax=unclassified Nocardioides TaxID=2615069 RepID=UPI0036228B19
MIEPPGDGERRRIPDPGFAGDDGRVSEEVSRALEAYAADPRAAWGDVLTALQRARLLVPVVAVLGEVEHDAAGLAHDKSSDMAAVLLQGNDGRLALLAFTGTGSLVAWNPEARPVPVTTQVAAQSALQDGAAALVVDVAGPTTLVIEGEDLQGLAAGWRPARVGGRSAWIRPEPE